jgi:UDP-2,3-diacylglucosamine pyrophosphatase LpxH
VYDALIISDIHLGSDLCRARELCRFLNLIRRERLPTRTLVLNGDVFDSHDFRRLDKHHWKVLSLLRKLSNDIRIVWVCGNHDGPAELISPLLGVEVHDEYVLETGGRRALVLHGHRFDNFIAEHPTLTLISDAAYWVLQKLDGSHNLARWAKRRSKTFVRCVSKIRDGALAAARARNFHFVCCGHTHQAETVSRDGVEYYNGGCWTESPAGYLAVVDGAVEVRRFGTADSMHSDLESAEGDADPASEPSRHPAVSTASSAQ